MKMNRLFITFLLFLVVLPIAYSVKPTQVFTGTVGLEIRIPQAEYAKQNEAVQLNIHVYNLSNGFPMKNDTTSCLFHMFNRTGHHILNEFMNFNEHENDFFLDIGGGNFTQLGFQSFIIGCNTSTIGGFVSGSIEVTETGEDDSNLDNTSGLVVFMFLFVITTALFIMPKITNNFGSKNPFLIYTLTKVFQLAGLFILMMDITLITQIADKANLGMTNELFMFLDILSYFIYPFAILFFFNMIIKSLRLRKGEIDKRRFGDDEDKKT